MIQIGIELLMAFIGSFGFGMIFHVRKQHILWASLGGFVTWLVYRVAEQYVAGIFFPTLVAAILAALYAECMARIRKAPAILFSITAVIPLVPGGPLYYTLSYIVQGKWEKAREYGYSTAMYAIGIAAGIGMVTALWEMAVNVWKEKRI